MLGIRHRSSPTNTMPLSPPSDDESGIDRNGGGPGGGSNHNRSHHARNESAENLDELFSAMTGPGNTTGFSLSCWSIATSPQQPDSSSICASIRRNPFATGSEFGTGFDEFDRGFTCDARHHDSESDLESDKDDDDGDDTDEEDGDDWGESDDDSDDDERDDDIVDPSSHNDRLPPPEPRVRRVSFHPTHLVEIHSIDRVELQDYSHVYYCVHELQKMMDDFRLEAENNNGACAVVRI